MNNSATQHQRFLMDTCLDNGVAFMWVSSGTLLIDRCEIDRVIEAIIMSGAEVLGLEGFELDGRHIHPRIDLIADLGAGVDSPEEVFRAISTWPTDVWVDIALKR